MDHAMSIYLIVEIDMLLFNGF